MRKALLRQVVPLALFVGGLFGLVGIERCSAAPRVKEAPPASPWIVELVENEGARDKVTEVSFLHSPTPATDTDLRLIASLKTLERLDLTRIEVTKFVRDDGVPVTRSRNIGAPEITDEGIAHIAQLPRLREIVASESKLTDRACEHLAASNSLEVVAVGYTMVSDRGLLRLAKLRTLKHLEVRNARVTDEGVREFRRQRPDVEVVGP